MMKSKQLLPLVYFFSRGRTTFFFSFAATSTNSWMTVIIHQLTCLLNDNHLYSLSFFSCHPHLWRRQHDTCCQPLSRTKNNYIFFFFCSNFHNLLHEILIIISYLVCSIKTILLSSFILNIITNCNVNIVVYHHTFLLHLITYILHNFCTDFHELLHDIMIIINSQVCLNIIISLLFLLVILIDLM